MPSGDDLSRYLADPSKFPPTHMWGIPPSLYGGSGIGSPVGGDDDDFYDRRAKPPNPTTLRDRASRSKPARATKLQTVNVPRLPSWSGGAGGAAKK